MNYLVRTLLLPGILAIRLSAGEAEDFAAVRAADDQRIGATIAGDVAKLATVLSDELHYGHPDGRVQSKAQFLETARRNPARNVMFVPGDEKLRTIAPGAVAMSGRAQIIVADHGRRETTAIRFLALWREEDGRWRLFAYQSTPLGAAAPAKKAP